jgi:RNA-binding protein
MPLTGKQRQHLRGLAHHLDPVVQMGHEGLSEAVVAQVNEALATHELIKVKLAKESEVPRDEVATALAAAAQAEVVQIIGRVLVLFRKPPKKAKVAMSADAARDGTEKKRGKEGSKGRPPRVRARLGARARATAVLARRKRAASAKPTRGR